ITPDEATGIGSWTAEDIALALQIGAEPDGEQLHPVMPYMRFSALSDQEALAIGEYLLSLDPVANEVPEGELSEEPAAYTPANEPPAEAPTDPVARGEQLVTVTNCGGCHTPKNEDGSAMADMLLAGAPLREEFAHNITPDEATGIGNWEYEDFKNALQKGQRPDGVTLHDAMPWKAYAGMQEDDVEALWK
ncbi:MAG: hypothetical protein KDB32_13800, partial [Planctomycetes bacterium]|nr:hypothetical protein [Planctomycetota bacterium]